MRAAVAGVCALLSPLLLTVTLQAQETGPVVRQLNFAGNRSIEDEILRAAIVTTARRECGCDQQRAEQRGKRGGDATTHFVALYLLVRGLRKVLTSSMSVRTPKPVPPRVR